MRTTSKSWGRFVNDITYIFPKFVKESNMYVTKSTNLHVTTKKG